MMGNQEVTGASPVATGLAGAEAPEPHAGLGSSSGIPSAYDTQDALDRMGSFLCILEGADHDGQRELWLQAIDDSVFKRDFRVLYMSFENLSMHATQWLHNWLSPATRGSDEIIDALKQARQVLSVYQPESAPTFYMEAIWNADAVLDRLRASGMEAPSGGETAQTGSTEGDSPTAKPERPMTPSVNPMTDIPIVELRNCPFCNGDDIVTEDNGHAEWLRCNHCGATGPWIEPPEGHEFTGNELADQWNTRAPDPALKECVEALKKARPYVAANADRDSRMPAHHRGADVLDEINATLAAMTKGEE